MPLNIDWQQILLHLLNFFILGVGLTFLLYNPVRKFLEKRRKHFEEREESTLKKEAKAKEKEAEYTEKLENAKGEIQAMQEEAKAISEENARLTVQSANKEAENILKHAKASATAEREKLINSVGDELTEMVITATEKLLSVNQNEQTDALLYDRFINGESSDGENALKSAEVSENQARLVVMNAEQKAAAMLSSAKAEAEKLQESMVSAAYEKMADTVAAATEKLLTEECVKASDEELYDKFLASVGQGEVK